MDLGGRLVTPPVWYEVTRIDDPGRVLGHVEAPYLARALRTARVLWGGREEEYSLRPVRRPPGWRRSGR